MSINQRSIIALFLLALTACGRPTPPAAIATEAPPPTLPHASVETLAPAPTETSAAVPTDTPDTCAGATEPGARQRFTLEQITPCLDTIPEVSAFITSNVEYDVEYDLREHGGNEYAPAEVVYQRGIDDADGHAILQCYLLEENGLDAFVIGLSIESPVGSNVCGVTTDQGILTLFGGGEQAGPFASMADLAEYFIGKDWMQPGGSLRTLKASQITQITTDTTSPSVLELPWVSHTY
jgi:hypothetical protein